MTMTEKKSASIVLGSLIFLSGLGWTGGSEPKLTAGPSLFAANAAALDSENGGNMEKKVAAGLGIVEPASGIINLAARMPGVIASISKSEGDAVKSNDVIAELVNDDLKAQYAQAESSVRVEAARLAIVENGPRPEEIKQAEAKVREQLSSTRLYETQLQRRQVLARDGAVAREAVNEAQRTLNVSLEQLDSAQKQLDLLRQGSRREEVEAARATYKLAQDKLAEAKAMLEKSYIRSTLDGVILRQYLEPGEAVSMQPDAVIMQIADISQLVVRTQIDENDISGLKVGQKAQISAPSLGGEMLTGTVTRISPRLGAKTVTAETPTEKRDTRVLDVIVALEPGLKVPVYLRVDVVIDLTSKIEASSAEGMVDVPLRTAINQESCLARGCADQFELRDSQTTGSIRP